MAPRTSLRLAALLGGLVGIAVLRPARGDLPHGHPSPGVSHPERPGFELWLVEDFDAPLDLDHDPFWTWSDGGLGEGQVRFTKEAIKFEDGKMKIEAAVRPQGLNIQSCSNAEVGEVGPKKLTSGELRSRHNMFRYGYYETRMKAPSVKPWDLWTNGNYVSTMFVYRDAKFRHWREIDVEVTGDAPDSVTMNVLYAENTAQWNDAIQQTQEFTADGSNVRSDFHTYAFEWLPTGITWYFDGQVMGHHAPEGGLPIPELSTKIMMNLWVFGETYGFGGPFGWNNQYPMHSEYDWFRFYRWTGDTSYPCVDATDSCLTEDDKYLSANNPCDGIPQVGGTMPCVAYCPQPALQLLSNLTWEPGAAAAGEAAESLTLLP